MSLPDNIVVVIGPCNSIEGMVVSDIVMSSSYGDDYYVVMHYVNQYCFDTFACLV
jgi:hypothetical protein